MSTTETALTAHLVVIGESDYDEIIKRASKELYEKFKIDHPTLQIERGSFSCSLAPDDKV
ncbi:hypothetical protein D3C72_2533530 [compost metagenome]